jgi:hypothetical protein
MEVSEARVTKCTDCRFCVLEDHGYSNYTVEGTNFRCAKRLHPDGEFDRFYGEDKRLNFASACASFVSGQPLEIDCDREFVDTFTPEQREIYDMDLESTPCK